MPDMDGIEVLGYLAARECGASIVIMTGHNSAMLGRAERLGAA
jgi:FixJ family two-component response regulator